MMMSDEVKLISCLFFKVESDDSSSSDNEENSVVMLDERQKDLRFKLVEQGNLQEFKKTVRSHRVCDLLKDRSHRSDDEGSYLHRLVFLYLKYLI